MNALCKIVSMQHGYPKTDNVNLVVRALSCDSPSALKIKRLRDDPKMFYEKCINLVTNNGDRPKIHVSDSSTYLNITKSALIKDIIFDGIHQFTHLHATIKNKTYVYKPKHWPMTFC